MYHERCHRHGTTVPGYTVDPTRRVRFTAGADHIWHIYRVAADLKSASSLRNLPQSVEFSVQYNVTYVGGLKETEDA